MPLSTFLRDRNPSRLRGLQMLAFTDTGIILARTNTSDSGGGVTSTWGTTGTVSCRIDPLGDRGESRATGGRIDERSTHRVTTTAGAAVPTDSRFVITGRGTFEVTAAHTRTDALTTVFEVVEAS